VADPFLWVQPNGSWYIFFETKTSGDMEGRAPWMRLPHYLAHRRRVNIWRRTRTCYYGVHGILPVAPLPPRRTECTAGPPKSGSTPSHIVCKDLLGTCLACAGDIGVAESHDGGASWRYLGLALDEPWHLSYPFVFQWQGQAYMLPEGYGSGALRLYRAVEFPLHWEFAAMLVDRPLIDTSLVEWEGRWWMFTSDAVSVVEHAVALMHLRVCVVKRITELGLSS
jgi:hypothetical protein